MEQDAAPAGPASSAGLSGGLGAPPYGHYDPCARSSLNGRGNGDVPAVRKRGPGSAGRLWPFRSNRRGGAPGGERARVRARRASKRRETVVRLPAPRLPFAYRGETDAQAPGGDAAAGTMVHARKTEETAWLRSLVRRDKHPAKAP
jgi:hypothetical protein